MSQVSEVAVVGNVNTEAAEAPESAEAAVVAQAEASAAEAQAAEDAARAEAAKTLKALVKSYRAGEAAYRKGLLEAGRLAHEYILQRVALRDTREAAVQTIAGRLAEECASKVDVNKLVRCYWAWALLGKPLEDDGDKALKSALDALPYRHLRDAWSQLVTRENGATVQERWTLLPGLEESCAVVFRAAVKDKLSKDAAEGAVKQLLAEAARLTREAAEKRAAEAKAKAEAAKAEGNPLAASEAAKEAQAAEAQAAEAKAREEKASKAAEGKKKAEAAPAVPATAEAAAPVQAPADKPARERAASAENLLPTAEAAQAATAKDWAEMLAECAAEHPEIDDVVRHLLGALKAHVSRPVVAALDAALLVMARRESKPAANGAVAVAAVA